MDGTTQDTLKRRAAEYALDYVRSGMALGLGTGSTVAHLLDLLGEALRSGRLTDIVGVPTSVRTEQEAARAGIPLIRLGQRDALDLAIDGADEVSPRLDLIKGMGGALLREKMVAQASDRFVIIADDSKLVDRLGTKSPLPVEIVPWGLEAHVRFLESWGANVIVRPGDTGTPLESDNGNLFLDCSFPDGIDDPEGLEDALRRRSGIIESGLFLGMTDEVIVAGSEGIRRLGRTR